LGVKAFIGLRGIGLVLSAAFAGCMQAPLAADAQGQADAIAAAKHNAIGLLNAGRAQEACDTLQPLLAAHQDDLVLRFVIGQCLVRTGHARAAIEQYHLILARDPNAIRARAELASAEYAVGESHAARADFQAVLAQNIPSAVRTQLQAALEKLPMSQQWSGAASVGLMYDGNADAGPWKSVIPLFGAPFQLANSPPRAESDWATLGTAGINYSDAINDDVALLAGVSASAVAYSRFSHYDYDGYSLVAGPAFRIDGMRLATNIGANLARLGDALYSFSWGAGPDLTIPIAAALALEEEIKLQHNHYYTSALTDGWSAASTTSVQWHFAGTAAFLQPRLTLAHYNARNAIYTDDQIGGAVDLFQPIGAGFSVLFEPGINAASYRAPDLAFGTTRRDTTYSVTANLGYELGFHHSQLALGVTVTGNRSNQPLYTYNRTQTTLQFKLPF